MVRSRAVVGLVEAALTDHVAHHRLGLFAQRLGEQLLPHNVCLEERRHDIVAESLIEVVV